MKTARTMLYLRVAAVALLTWGAGVSALADYKSTVLSKNPIGYWQLNETNPIPVLAIATNTGSLGTDGNGVYLNGATTEPGPIAGSAGETAVKFDGISQKVQVPYNAALNPPSALTVEAWVRPEIIDTWNSSWARAVVSTFGGNAQGGGYKLMFNAGTPTTPDVFKFTLWNGSSGTETFAAATTAGTILATNNGPWFHMVGTWSSSDGIARLYVNGIQLASASRTYTPTTSSPLRIAATDTDPTDPVGASMDPGAIAHVAVYDSALDPTNVLAHYQAGTNAAANYAATVLADHPVGYWKLNETSFPAMPVAVNQGTRGAALNGAYCYASAPAAAGPLSPNYGGFSDTNMAVYATNTAKGGGGFVLFPPMRSTSDSNNFTVVAWIKRDGPQMAFANIFGRRINVYAKSAFGFGAAGLNRLGYNWDDNASQYNFDTKLTVPDGVWTLAAWVITPTNTVIYMDTGTGLQAATNTFANTTTLGFVHQVFIGTTGGNYQGRRFNGTVDELAVWTNALTANDIWDLRNAAFGSGLFIARQPAPVRPVMLGGKVPISFLVAGATNYMPLSYQILKNGVPSGAPVSSTPVTYNNVQLSDLASTFSVAVITNGGSVATLTSSGVNLQRWTVPGTYSEVVESYHPDAYYRFSETSPGTIYDLASGLDGTTNGLISATSGPQATDGADFGFETNNAAYSFNGAGGSPLSGGYAVLSGSGIAFPDPSATKTTIALWINPTASQIAYSAIYYSRCTDYAGLEYNKNGGYELGIAWNGNYDTATAVYTYPGVWNFVAMVVTNDAATFYVYSPANGWQSNTIAGSFPPRNLTGGTGTCIGTDPNLGLNRGVKGMIDEVAVINQVLQWEDIQKLAMSGAEAHVSIQPAGGNNYRIGWSYGTLQWAGNVGGPWFDVPGAVAPSFTTNSTGSNQKFFRSYR